MQSDNLAPTGISIHAPHARSDRPESLCLIHPLSISIHAPHARSDDGVDNLSIYDMISIHAPHARSDCFKFVPKPSTLRISIHAPHARSDCTPIGQQDDTSGFQSTLLMRGATPSLTTGAMQVG